MNICNTQPASPQIEFQLLKHSFWRRKYPNDWQKKKLKMQMPDWRNTSSFFFPLEFSHLGWVRLSWRTVFPVVTNKTVIYYHTCYFPLFKLNFSKESIFTVSTSPPHIAVSTSGNLVFATTFNSAALIDDQSLLLEDSSPLASGIFYPSPPMCLHYLHHFLGVLLSFCKFLFMFSLNLNF